MSSAKQWAHRKLIVLLAAWRTAAGEQSMLPASVLLGQAEAWGKKGSLEIFLLWHGRCKGLRLGLVSLHLKALSIEWCIIWWGLYNRWPGHVSQFWVHLYLLAGNSLKERFSLVKETEKEGSQLSTFPKQNWVEKSEFHLTPWVLASISAIV